MAVRGQSPGIKVGTAITLLSKSARTSEQAGKGGILYRDFNHARSDERRLALLASLNAPEMDTGYTEMQPQLELGLPFKPMVVGESWQDWPALPDLFPTSFPGVKTSRDSFLVNVDLDPLKARVIEYFSADFEPW